MLIIHVALKVPLSQTFDYFLPDDMSHAPPVIGGRVYVQFRSRKFIGIVISIDTYSTLSFNKLHPIINVIDYIPLFPKNLWNILLWAANYYHYPIGEVLFHSLPYLLRKSIIFEIELLFEWISKENKYNWKFDNFDKLKRQKNILTQKFKLLKNFNLVSQKKFSTFEISYLQKLYYLFFQRYKKYQCKQIHSHEQKTSELNSEQVHAIENICNNNEKFISWLLIGVTGSGKTEVYLRVFETILSKGKQALLLVPEIGLIPQTIDRFQKYFNVPVDVYHSRLNRRERLISWMRAKMGKSSIIIGTRSAIFTPFIQLGVIVIDEEHDSSYKQQDGWKYHARDIAVYRAYKENIPIILGSATPSLESIYNVKQKKYHQLILNKRAGNAQPVVQQLFDLKGQKLKHGLSITLLNMIKKHLKQNNQVMLFLNRRGFAPILLCHECGWIAECKRCDHFYTLHLHERKLFCHHCENKYKLPHQCNECGSTFLLSIGLGTEQLESIIKIKFPNVPIIRIDRDTTLKKGSMENYIKKIKNDSVKILIGTQMLTKGHHFPNVTFVALLNIDNILFSEDFRMTERFAQLYIQVSGRSGRSYKQGEVFLQTHYPDHPLLQTLLKRGYMNFAQNALQERKDAKLPPFFKQIAFRAEDYDNKQAEKLLNKFNNLLNIDNILYNHGILFLGPIPSLLSKKSGRFRWQLLLSHSSRTVLHKLVSAHLPLMLSFPKTKHVKWTIDIDPINS